MSILTKYTLRCLKQNRVRTLVTVIGIVLSVALFTAVSEGAYSGQQYLLNVIKASAGIFHGQYRELSAEQLAELRGDASVKQVETIDTAGFALLAPERDEPFLVIGSMSKGLPDLVPIRLKEGRMPENDRELLISEDAQAKLGISFQVGQTLTLNVGQRCETSSGELLGVERAYLGEEETLKDCQEQLYTVVGIYRHFYSGLCFYPTGELALTTGSGGSNYKSFFTMQEPGALYQFMETHFNGSWGGVNDEFLMLSGVSEDRIVLDVFSGLAAILFGLIAFGSIVLIYNAFSISVSERTRQFGMLKSIGATRGQIRRSVLFEALLLSVVAIPLGLLVGCGGIGLTLRFLQPAFNRLIQVEGAENVTIRLVWNLPALGLAGGVALLTTLLSAWIPAGRAARLSPITAIRQSKDVKIQAKTIRGGRLTGKLFGISGTLASKNFKRSRKQYRSTVLSLFLSVLLFVSASSFSDYLIGNIGEAAELLPAELRLEVYEMGTANREKLFQELLAVPGVTGGAYATCLRVSLESVPREALDRELLQLASAEEIQGLPSNLYYVPDAFYAELCREAGLDPALKQALAYVSGTLPIERPDGYIRIHFTLLNSQACPISLTVQADRKTEACEILDWEYNDAGEAERVLCVRSEDMAGKDAADPEDTFYLPPDKFCESIELTVGALLQDPPLARNDSYPGLYLPLSMLPQAGAGEPEQWEFSQPVMYYLQAPEHEKAFAAVEEKLLPLRESQGLDYYLFDTREKKEITQAGLLVLNVFSYGFILLISLIAVANVFNTISTNIALRRREFATLKSVGMGDRAFGRMMRFECLLYGCKALLWGLPASMLVSRLLFNVVNKGFQNGGFRLPWTAIAIASGSVFLVVFATMLYAMRKIKKANPIDALKQETL